jgi:hypothetical protein
MKQDITKILFFVILAILVFNAIINILNLIEDGLTLQVFIPACCWSLASIIWTATYTHMH